MLSEQDLEKVTAIVQRVKDATAAAEALGPLTADEVTLASAADKVDRVVLAPAHNKKRKREHASEQVLELLRAMPEADALKILHTAVLEYPTCCKDLYKCDDCDTMVTLHSVNMEVEARRGSSHNVCDACCSWCRTCETKFCEGGAYHHNTCKTRNYTDSSVDSSDSETDSSSTSTSPSSATEDNKV